MNKVSSKLAAGVRKVKSQQAAVPGVAKTAYSEIRPGDPRKASKASAAVESGWSDPGPAQQTERVWPD
jgi:hypothetical protein